MLVTRAAASTVLLVLFAHGAEATAQVPDEGVVSVHVRDGVTRGDELHAAMRPAEALEAFRGVLAGDSTRFDALWRAAREAVNLGMLTENGERARSWFAAGEDFAKRAVAAEPDAAAGYQWLAIALGRRALLEGPRTRVHLSANVREAALAALARDSTAAGAHNVLGQWNAEIQRLGGLARFTAERILGGEVFREATWDDALHHLERAIELEPDALVHRVALARVYLDLDRPGEARHQLLRAVELPDRQPTDPATRAEARALLGELD